MSVSGLSGLLQQNLYKTWVKTPDEDAEDKFKKSLKDSSDPANSAVRAENVTGAAISGTTATTLWQAQVIAQSSASAAIDVEAEEPALKAETVAQQFLEMMNKSPEELMREAILKELGYTEEELASLDPKERAKIEQEIKERLEIKIEESLREKGIDVTRSPGADMFNQNIIMDAAA